MNKFVLLIAACILGLSPALAQTPPAPPPQLSADARVDAAKLKLDQVQSTLAHSDDLDDTALAALRGQIDPITAELNTIVGELGPKIDAAKAQLAQLGPKPGPKDPAEPAPVSAERASQDQLFGNLDATSKRAKVLSVQAGQLSDSIGSKIRSRFANALLARSSSLLSPSLWADVLRELPSDYRAVVVIGSDWVTGSWNRLSEWQRAAFGGLLLLIGVSYWPVWRVACRVRSRRDDAEPSRLRKALAALRVATATAAVPVGTVMLVGLLADLFDLPNQFQGIGRAITIGVAVVSVMTGLMRGLLAPKSPNWRLVPISDLGATALYHVTISVTSVVAVQKIVEALNEIIRVALPTAVATRGLGAIAIVVIMLSSIKQTILARRAGMESLRTQEMEHWAAILKLIGWTIMVALVVALLIGYVAFTAFLVEEIVVIVGTLASLSILLPLADDGIPALLNPKGRLARALTATMGVQAGTFDHLAILAAGVAKIVLYFAAFLLFLTPWRLAAGDLMTTLQAAFFGFSVGDVTISLSTIIVAAGLFVVLMAVTRSLQRWLEIKYLPHTKLDTGLQNSIKTSLGYVGSLIALGTALAHLGLSFERLTLIAGGLSVGIGLGLQTITNNFVSGLILLWERAVRVGDRITVGADQGYVRRINVRSTEIETFDRALVVMPNSSLITGVVKNWVRNDRIGRISLPFALPLTSDPEEIRTILIKAGKAHDLVLAIPTPQVFFTTLTDTQMHFDLVCYVEDVESSIRVTSDLLFDIYARFKAIGIVAPAAPAVVTSPALDKLDAWLSAKTVEIKPRA